VLPCSGSCAVVTSSSSLGTYHLGCLYCTREHERKETIIIHAAYMLIPKHKSHYKFVQCNGVLLVHPAQGETPPPTSLARGKTHADTICTRPRSKEEHSNAKQEIFQKWSSPPNLNFLTHAPVTIISIAHITTLVFFGIISVLDLPLMSWHWSDLPLPALVIAIGDDWLFTLSACGCVSFSEI